MLHGSERIVLGRVRPGRGHGRTRMTAQTQVESPEEAAFAIPRKTHIVLGRVAVPEPAPYSGALTQRLTFKPSADGSIRRGRMTIILGIHGGLRALSDVLDGLVERNERSLREGVLPPVAATGFDKHPSTRQVWRDGVTAILDGEASIGTIAAWRAAEERLKGRNARVGFIDGVPTPVVVTPANGVVGIVAGFDPRAPKVGGLQRSAIEAARLPYADHTGRVQQDMVLTLDDDHALPVREVNTAIARHNAHLMLERNLPKLYESGVRYGVEGSPELWWDAQEILDRGVDDCEGLAAYRAGELILEGLDASVYTRFIQTPAPAMGGGKGGRLFHAVTRVKLPPGVSGQTAGSLYGWDDPSVNVGDYVGKDGAMKVPFWYRSFAEQCRREGRDL